MCVWHTSVAQLLVSAGATIDTTNNVSTLTHEIIYSTIAEKLIAAGATSDNVSTLTPVVIQLLHVQLVYSYWYNQWVSECKLLTLHLEQHLTSNTVSNNGWRTTRRSNCFYIITYMIFHMHVRNQWSSNGYNFSKFNQFTHFSTQPWTKWWHSSSLQCSCGHVTAAKVMWQQLRSCDSG